MIYYATQYRYLSCRSLGQVKGLERGPEKEDVVAKNFDETQKLGQENVAAATKAAVDVFSKGVQAIVREVTDYSKNSFEEGTKLFGQLLAAKSPDKAIEIQQAYFKNAYEGFIARSTNTQTQKS